MEQSWADSGGGVKPAFALRTQLAWVETSAAVAQTSSSSFLGDLDPHQQRLQGYFSSDGAPNETVLTGVEVRINQDRAELTFIFQSQGTCELSIRPGLKRSAFCCQLCQ